MDKQKFLRMAEDRNFISSIFNYCDRWCERCALTSRCFLYATEGDFFPSAESHDISKSEFWKSLHDCFELTMELGHDSARERGIDLSAVDLGRETARWESKEEEVKKSPMVQAAKDYALMVSVWLTVNRQLFDEKQRELTQNVRLNIGNAESTAADIRDAVDVIQWYQYLIEVKLMRAFGREELSREQAEDEETEAYPSDSDGSAKVALVALDQSIEAWGKLSEHFQDGAASIMEILVHLGRLRTSVENRFTHARSFVRPGFDQVV